MDMEYFIRVIIEGRDNLSPALRGAVTSVRAEVQKLKGEMGGLETSFAGVNRSSQGASGGMRSFRNDSERARAEAMSAAKAAGMFEKELSSTKHTLNEADFALRKHATGLGKYTNVGFAARSMLKGLSRGFYDTERGVRDLDATLRKAQGTIFNLGYNAARSFDSFFKSFTRLNTIAAILAPLIFTLIGAVVNLGAALVAVASAAGVAAVALGGALVAGLTQLIPVATVVIALFQRLKLVFQASALETKNHAQAQQNAISAAKAHREATERVADAQYSLKQAYQAVRDNANDLRTAETKLTEARRQATRDLVDSRFARTDAILAERDASLSLLEAKQQLIDLEKQQQGSAQDVSQLKAALQNAKEELQAAIASGNQAAIVAARSQVGILEQELSGAAAATPQQRLALQRAKLTVTEAGQAKKESEVTRARAIQDANKAERLGIEMAPGVVAARKAVRTATEQLANSEHDLTLRIRELRDAMIDVKTAGSQNQNTALKNILAQLDGAEKRLLKIVDGFKKEWKKAMRPITDDLVNAVGDALLQIEKLFHDKKFMAGLSEVGKSLSAAIRSFSKFLTSPEQRHFFEQFSHLASKNMPIILHIFEQIIRLMERVGVAFAPVLNMILKSADKWLAGKVSAADRPVAGAGGQQTTALDRFAKDSGTYLVSLTHFFGSFLHLIGAIVSVAKGPGKTALDDLTKTFNRWAKELQTTGRKGGQEFFSRAITTSGQILTFLGKFITLIFHLTQGSGFGNFIKFLSGPGLSSLQGFGSLYGTFFKGLGTISNWPVIGDVFKALLELFLAAKLIPGFGIAMKGLAGLFKTITGKTFSLFGKRGDTPVEPLYVHVTNTGGWNRGPSPGGSAVKEEESILAKLTGGLLTGAGLKLAVKTLLKGSFAEMGATIGSAGIAGLVTVTGSVLAGAGIGAIIGNIAGKWMKNSGLGWLQVFDPNNHNIGSRIAKGGLSIALTPVRGFVDSIKGLKDLFTGHPIGALKDVLDIFKNPFDAIFGGGDNKKSHALVVSLKTGKHFDLDLKKFFGQSMDIDKTAPPRGFAWVDDHGQLTGYSKSHKPTVTLTVASIAGPGSKDITKIGKQVATGFTKGFSTLADEFKPSKLEAFFKKNVLDPIRAVLGIASPSKKTIPIGQSMSDGLVKGWGDTLTSFFDPSKLMDFMRNRVLNPINTWADQVTADGKFFWKVGDRMQQAVAAGFAGITHSMANILDALPGKMLAEAEKLRKKFAKVGNMISVEVVAGLAGLKHTATGIVASAANASSQVPVGTPPGPVAGAGSPMRSAAVNDALGQLGKPYIWGAAGPNAFDCSGLVQWALSKVGISIPRTTYAQVGSGRAINLGNILPGDAIFTNYGENGIPGPGHEGMYIGGGTVVEAPYPGQVVKTIPLRDFISGGPFAIRDFFPAEKRPKVPKFDVGGEVKGSLGRAVPIVAHVGEWILNDKQKERLAQLTRRPIGLIKDFLFGPKPNPHSPVPMNEAAKRRARAAALLKNTAGGRYYGPVINDWNSDALGPMQGGSQHGNALGNEPVFIDTPLHQYVEIGWGGSARRALELLKRSHGFWIPETVKRAHGYADASRKQIQDWKSSNILAGLTDVDPGFRNTMLKNILRSPLWSYGMGGEVGWNPAPISSQLPSFASGGVVTTPAAMPTTSTGAHVEQAFAIHTASPHVDIDYIMRRAKVLAEGSF